MTVDAKTIDPRFMAAAIRYARRNEGRTATNPSVACLIVRDGVIVGRGVTAVGGRPHAEPLALAEAGEKARGATAYVTLEPCAHHGRTPPCAQTLIDAGVARVVTAVVDPDPRVDSKGHAMLRAAGIEVVEHVLANEARLGLSAYLNHKLHRRPQVALKLAVSADGMLGFRGGGQAPITGPVSRAQSHLMRAMHHAILVGAGTIAEDDPELTCRLPGMESRSPLRIVLDASGRVSPQSRLVQTASQSPVLIASPLARAHPAAPAPGVEILACETVGGRIALPELLDDLGARGVMSLIVEGGAQVAKAFVDEGLVDRIAMFCGANPVAQNGEGVPSPLTLANIPAGFVRFGQWQFGEDRLFEFERKE